MKVTAVSADVNPVQRMKKLKSQSICLSLSRYGFSVNERKTPSVINHNLPVNEAR